MLWPDWRIDWRGGRRGRTHVLNVVFVLDENDFPMDNDQSLVPTLPNVGQEYFHPPDKIRILGTGFHKNLQVFACQNELWTGVGTLFDVFAHFDVFFCKLLHPPDKTRILINGFH